MKFRGFFYLLPLLATVTRAQDNVVLNNGDTVAVKVSRYDNSSVEYQYQGETLSQVMSTKLINTILLGSGRTIKPQVTEAERIAPVFGLYKGNFIVVAEDKNYGLQHLKTGKFEEPLVEQVISKIKTIGSMTGACFATYKLDERLPGQPERGTVEYYAFAIPQQDFIKDDILGKTFTLLLLDSYSIGQSELLSFLNKETVQHSIHFSNDGKLTEDGHEAGTYVLKGNEIELKYEYTNKKGKLKLWGGNFKVGSYDSELIQLYNTNPNFTYFQNIILKRS